MRTFCEQHADVFSISDTKPHWQLMVKIPNANATTKKLAAYIGDRGGTVALGDLEVWKRENPTAARTIHKGGRSIKDFFDGCACAQRLLTVESTSGIVTKVSLKAAEGPPMVGPVGSTDDRARAAVNLALYLRGHGGSLLAPQIHRYYAQFPKHKQVIGKLKKFCEEHGDFLVYENDPHPGKISLPRRPESKPDRILAGPCHAASFRSKPPPAPPEMTLESADPVVCIAASLAMFVRSQGGSIPGSNMSEYYKIHPSHKQVISDAGLRAFCERYDGLFLFEPLPGSGKLSLRSFCCHYLRGECVHATDHDGKLHSMPASSPVVCSFGTKCIKGHWKRLEDLAKRSLGAVTSPAFSTTKLNVAEIRWTHDAIRVTFRDGKLLMETLVDLLAGKLRPSDLPMVEVLELGGSFYAIEGNRRLWIFKELQAITGEALTIEVQSRKLDVKGFTQSFTSKNGGQSVEFYTKSRERTYPSMSFALAVFFGRVPSELEMSIGREVAKAPAGMMNVEALAAALSLEVGPGLESQLRQRPDLFQLTRGEVSLADCMTSFGVLAAHAAPNDQPPADRHEEADAAQEKLQMPELIAGEGRHWDESLREILEETLLFLLKQSEQFHIAWLESDYLVSLADCPGATGFQQPHRVDIASNADDSTIEAPSLEEELSHLLRAKGGSIPLGEMEWEEVCMTHFKNLQELASFLESRPRRFSVRWEGTQQVASQRLLLDTGSSTLAFCEQSLLQQTIYEMTDFVSCNTYNPGGNYTGYWGPFVVGDLTAGNLSMHNSTYSVMANQVGMPCSDGVEGIFGIAFQQLDAGVPIESFSNWNDTAACPIKNETLLPPPLLHQLQASGGVEMLGIYWSGDLGEEQARLYIDEDVVNEHYDAESVVGPVALGEFGWFDVNIQRISVGDEEFVGFNCTGRAIGQCTMDTGTPTLFLPQAVVNHSSQLLEQGESGNLTIWLEGASGEAVPVSFDLAALGNNSLEGNAQDSSDIILGMPLWAFYYTVFNITGHSVSLIPHPIEAAAAIPLPEDFVAENDPSS
ncbi:unnamed protein product, partial [Symbiodinium sp. CCMP2456]